ncbi:623a1889-8a71-435a-831a-e86d5baec5f8 [Thermothielavioides terrestris]|uniref:623a1889-8a71-435a-831a-e86d5baec5f8 n=1 Tax=Thermothielavioides terrestris TaxID=2587410 RepID=A0A446BH70_9PEZI|nr:623a1889-8a71-435a-831a-e86d5baec5f8 [Thermothielavioides terrestris]
MVQYIFTPWRNRRELLAVRRQFYPEHHHQPSPTQSQPSCQPRPGAATTTTTTTGSRQRPYASSSRISSSSRRSRSRWNATATATTPAAHEEEEEDGLEETEAGREGESENASESERESEKQRQRDREIRAGKQAAVARVSMWMQRGGCPHMVESTALLTAAVLSDRDLDAFVTGLLDSHQDKQRKMSMYDVAKSVGLPATFVELRHQATHEQLPSLTRLRGAAAKALAWIWDYYWRHLPEADGASPGSGGAAAGKEKEAEEENEEERELRALLRRYLEGGEAEEGLRAEIGRYDEALVLRTLGSFADEARDGKVLRRVVAMEREILEGAGDPDRMEEDDKAEEQDVKDLEQVRVELGKAWEVLKEVEETETAEAQADDPMEEVEMTDDRPAWTLYEEQAWVPKPIGVV